MEIITVVAILFSVFVSLGVGASTLAVSEFFYAISDGTIDPKERGMLGVVYTVLRVAMIGILLTAIVLVWQGVMPLAIAGNISAFGAICFTMLAVLYGNALLMTWHIVPSNIGPAFQAGAWYTLGIANAAVGIGLMATYPQYLMGYATLFVIFLLVINGLMRYLKSRRT